MTWIERQLERIRSLDQQLVDGALAVLLLVVGIATIYTQPVEPGLEDPGVLALFTAVAVNAPVAIRRRAPLLALTIASAGILVHILADRPEGFLPGTMMVLTYTVGAWETPRRAALGLGLIWAVLIVLLFTNTPDLDTVGVVGNIAIFTVWWTMGVALRARREALEARVRQADERANTERQSAARAVAEERLRIAQELHDVVAHSMSVIAVQAGVGAHVLDDRPEQARSALEAISATSRGTLAEMRRLLGVLRDGEGYRSDVPAPGLADLPALVDDVRRAGVPVDLEIVGSPSGANAGVELSAYRVVQEALTNVIKHAGSPDQVRVRVAHRQGIIEVEVADDGRGAAALTTVGPGNGGRGGSSEVGGHGLVGMRERVELWGGDLSVGPQPGGGYRVRARLPVGEPE